MSLLSDYTAGRDNNYNLLRALAATIIAFYHSFYMALGPLMTDDTYPALYQLSQIVLNFFFVASGFLIAQSFERRRDLVSYIIARCLRLLPGVFVLSVLVCFVVGPLVTDVPLADYFGALQTWVYVPLTTALQPDALLPGVFASNTNPDEIVTAMWTLRYEVVCYVGLAFVGVFLGLQRSLKFSILMGLFACCYGVISYLTDLREIAGVNHLMHFGLSFFIGMVFFVYRSTIVLHWGIALGASLLAFFAYQVFGKAAEPVVIGAMAYVVFWLAYVPGGLLRTYNQLGDYSYGIYIYHYPVQQILMHWIGGFSAVGLFALSFPLVVCLAILSWVLVERPALKQLPRFSAWLKAKLPGRWQAARENV